MIDRATPPPPRRRPLWLVAALTILSLSVYLPLWLGFTWAELKRDLKDEEMQPIGHAFSLFVPGYGYWQVYRHFRLIRDLVARIGASPKVDPLSAALGVVLWSFTFLHYSNDPLFTALNLIELGAATTVVIYGQRALNAYWRGKPGIAAEERVLETDWLALAAAAAYFIFNLVGYISEPTG